MSTEPSRLQEALSLALNQQAEALPDTRASNPAIRYPVSGAPAANAGTTDGSAARPLLAASAALTAAAISVMFNAPLVLLASVAGIAVLPRCRY